MTRVFAAATAALLASCTAHGPAAVTVAPIVTASATPPPALVAPSYNDLGCGVYAKDGPAPDDVALRSCLERTAPKACDAGSSPGLATLELAVAMIDGRGGPMDIPGARKLLVGCFADVALQEVNDHAVRKERDPMTAPFETCEKYALTTLAAMECSVEETNIERGWLRRVEIDLPEDARRLLGDATRAFEAYAEKVGSIEYARYAGGSMRSLAMINTVRFLTHQRRVRLAAIHAFVAAPTSSEDLSNARDEIQRAFDAAHGAEPEAPDEVDAAVKLWPAYRDAELALYERVRPGSRAAVTALLGREHASALCSTVPP